MKRIVQTELLDDLPPDDPRAMHSRRDLRRLNQLMRHGQRLAAAMARAFDRRPPRVIADLGAGDGSLMLTVARKLGGRWPGVRVILLDRQPTVSRETMSAFAALGWSAEAVTADVFDWLASGHDGCDAIVANLFLHHFPDGRLAQFMRLAAMRAPFFVACETRRSVLAVLASRAVGAIGCNAITRHDARLSVMAGFTGQELSALWRAGVEWRLIERRAGLFTHFFSAARNL